MEWSEIETYIAQAKRIPCLSRQEELQLSRVIRTGKADSPEVKAARDRFLSANLRLVLSLAQKFPFSPLPLPDLVQEGNIGLMRAMEKYDPERGFKFSTYAVWWVRQAMMRASQKDDLIRLPVYKVVVRNRVRKAERQLGEDAPHARIAEAAGVSIKDVEEIRAFPSIKSFIEDLEDDDAPQIEQVVDENVEDTEARLFLSEIRKHRGMLFDGVSKRDTLMFDLRYGEESCTLQEIGTRVGLTRERVRQRLKRLVVQIRERAILLGLRGCE